MLLRRELTIAFRARVTWVVATLAALLVGHGFVLALNLYAAASRSVMSGALMQREMDPLAGILRPTLGGVELAVTLFVPVLAARLLAVEKERRSFGALALSVGSPTRVVAAKLLAAGAASLVVVAPAFMLVAAFCAMGAHLDPIETALALGAHVLHACFIAAVSVAAAAWSRTVAQATTMALVVAIAPWMIDAGEGYTALAWLGPLESMSVMRVLAPLEEGVLALGSICWLGIATAAAVVLAVVGGRFDLSPVRRVVCAAMTAIAALVLVTVARSAPAYDWTEYRRASYPPAVVDALRAIGEPIVIAAWFDREDSRRRQLERDVFGKLQLARANVRVTFPLDERRSSAYERGEDYGRLLIRVGSHEGETRSTSRREIAVRIFEIGGRDIPSFDQVPYPGYPAAWDAARLRFAGLFAYGLMPCMVLIIGVLATRRRKE
jgi:hypothetical protein